MKAPKGLGPAGRALWSGIVADLESGEVEWDLDARERAVLEAACRQADTNVALEQAIARDGLVVLGSAGQGRLNAAATEVRQGRIALQKLLADVPVPNEHGELLTPGQKRARVAAEARHGRRR